MWLIFNLKSEFKKIKESFKKRDDKILINSKEIKDLKENSISKREVDLMIREAMLKVREHTPQTPRTPMRKKADKLLNKAEIMQEIASMLQKGLSTNEAHHQIVEVKGLCKKTCFYKYLKKVREQIARTTRTNITN